MKVSGPNKDTCGFIIGIEPLIDFLEGIRTDINRGIIAEVYPYKPNDGSETAKLDSYRITKTAVIMEAILYANNCLQENNIKPT